MRKVFLRADAGADIGYGHFIRTLALADILKDEFDCTFFTADPTSYQIGEMEKVCKHVALEGSGKFDAFLDYLKGDEIVFLDNYFYTTEYQRQIKEKGSCLVCIDDMHDKHYVADLIINQAIGVTPDDFSCESYTRLALGMKYTLLRRPFYEACKIDRYPNEDSKLRIVVAFGGSDFMDLTSKTINGLVNMSIISSITAIVGDSYSSSKRVENEKVTYLKNQTAQQIADIFSICDVAILPTSIMMTEAMACGTTIIGGYYVLNQKEDYYEFSNSNMILGVGDYSEPDVVERIKKQLYGIVTKRSNMITAEIPQLFLNLFKSL
jgi:spore coat polysaccharide biosynthesis predicted glycosyltransferase SpsG